MSEFYRMDQRQQALEKWLTTACGFMAPILQALPGDASFRRYFRIIQGDNSFIAMDAPPEKENCLPYVTISEALRKQGLLTPEIIASDLTQGFLLITDFGDGLLLNTLNSANATALYTQALNALSILKDCNTIESWQLQPFTADFMFRELKLFQEWYLVNYLALPLSAAIQNSLEQLFAFLAVTAASQPQVFMHRDYHSANLMVLPSEQIGILDFQDAFIGPLTYDLVSLLRDCYISWPAELVEKLVLQYRDQLNLTVNDSEFLRWFDLMGLQRHLKALLTFSRKYRRDGNANYLKHIPRTLNYILQESRQYPECNAFYSFLKNTILPAQEEALAVCVG